MYICVCIYTRVRAHGDIHRLFQHALIVELHLARKGRGQSPTTGPSPGQQRQAPLATSNRQWVRFICISMHAIYLYIYIYMYIYMCIYIYVHKYMHTHTHTPTHTPWCQATVRFATSGSLRPSVPSAILSTPRPAVISRPPRPPSACPLPLPLLLLDTFSPSLAASSTPPHAPVGGCRHSPLSSA